jgi:RNA polymerase sigma factor for flagellar operon FliA
MNMSNTAIDYGKKQYSNPGHLFEENLALVKSIAQHICVRLPPGQTIDDLIQVGMIGLLEAARIYDPALGASFKSYASIRIRGAIIDELRRHSWLPRSVQQKCRKLSEAIRSVEGKLGRAATDREIADEMKETLEEYFETLEMVSGSTVFSLDDEDSDIDPGHDEEIPFNEIYDSAVKKKLTEVISTLPQQEKLVVGLYYEKELNLREIGAVLDVTESRVCQIHSQAIARMRARMRAWIESEKREY